MKSKLKSCETALNQANGQVQIANETMVSLDKNTKKNLMQRKMQRKI